MLSGKVGLSCLAFLSLLSTVRVGVAKKKPVEANNATNSEGSGVAIHKNQYHEDTANNRSRKDYIIAIEDSAPSKQRYDPVFQMLQRLAKRTRGQMAVMDYSNGYKRFNAPFLPHFGYRNPFFNDEQTNYEDEDDNDDGDDDDFNLRLGGKQSLVGRNVINNFLGLKKFGIEEERPRPRDDVRTVDEDAFLERNNEFAPSVVYEMDGDNQGGYDDDDDEEARDDNAYSRGFPGREPMFFFGNSD